MPIFLRMLAGKIAGGLLLLTLGAFLAWRYRRSKERVNRARWQHREAMLAAREALYPGAPSVSLVELADRVHEADVALTAAEIEAEELRERRRKVSERAGRLSAGELRRKANELGV